VKTPRCTSLRNRAMALALEPREGHRGEHVLPLTGLGLLLCAACNSEPKDKWRPVQSALAWRTRHAFALPDPALGAMVKHFAQF
jgi:hypothetical protein